MIPVYKYHGLGNDFVMVHYKDVLDLDFSKLAIKLCDRHTFIGGDGLIIVKDKPLEMIYFNSDGSRAEMCGNGIRCFAAFAHDQKLITSNNLEVLTLAGAYHIQITNTKPFMAQVDMNTYDYDPQSYYGTSKKEIINQELSLSKKTVLVSSLLLGVPHTMVEHPLDKSHMMQLGQEIEKSSLFSQGTNVNFYQIINQDTIEMQTFERGAGLTLACGTGACATFAHLYHTNQIKNNATIKLPLGNLYIKEENNHIIMTGPAEFICKVDIKKEDYL